MKLFGIPYQPRQLYFFVGDLVAGLAAIALAHLFRLGGFPDGDELSRLPASAIFFLSTNLILLYLADGYNSALDFRRAKEVVRLGLTCLVQLALQTMMHFILTDMWWGRGIAGLTVVCFGVVLVLWRAGISRWRPRPLTRMRTLLVGDGDAERVFAEAVAQHPEYHDIYEVIGCLAYPRFGARRGGETPIPEDVCAFGPVPVLGPVSSFKAVLSARRVDLVVVAIRGSLSSDLTRDLLEAKARGVQIEEMPTIYKRLTGKVPIAHLNDSWLIFGPVFSGGNRFANAIQRSLDVFFALIGLFFSAPVILLAAIAVKLESAGPAFFLQERLGLNERPFWIIKLRTMGVDAEAKSGAVWSAGAADPRVTRVGRFLRRTRVDELPQFWNVLRGDMSILGPRPEREHFVKQLKLSIPFYGLRFAVKPGVTGWAQVNYRYGATEAEAAEKLCYELYAIQELNPLLYALTLLKTVQTMLLRPGS